MLWFSDAVIGVGVLAVTSRKWSAVLMASALGMGLFIGVAFGPAIDRLGAAGSQIVALDDGSSVAQPTASTSTSSAPSSSTSSDSSAPVAPAAPAPVPAAPYIPPAAVPPPPVEEPPPVPPSDPTPPGTGGNDDDPASAFAGTVVHVNPLASSYTLAVRGELYAVHAKDLPDPGAKVEVPLIDLANGTFEEHGDRAEDGTSSGAEVNGFVTWVRDDGAAPAYTVSMRGTSLLVTVPPADDTKLPKLGEFVTAKVSIDEPSQQEARRLRRKARLLASIVSPAAPGASPVTVLPEPDPPAPPEGSSCTRSDPVRYVAPRETLVQQAIEPSGDTYDYFDLAGYVQAACAGEDELVLSADDIRAAGADLVLKAPKGIDLGDLESDSPVLATAEVAKDGTLSLAGLASDDGADGADDEAALQGDLGS